MLGKMIVEGRRTRLGGANYKEIRHPIEIRQATSTQFLDRRYACYSIRMELVVDTLEIAPWRRRPGAGLIHHADRGAQYTALSFGKRSEEAGIVSSMGRAGSALDNAISESFVMSLKIELFHRHRYLSREAVRAAIFNYIESFYNWVRRHSSLGT